MKASALLILLAGAAAGCGRGDAAASSQPVSGIHFALEDGGNSAHLGQDLVFRLRFSNRSRQAVRIFLARSEPFRAGQSSLLVTRAADGTLVDLQPAPRPHGYVVDEGDFHLIPPGETFSDRQTLRLTPERFKAGEEYVVRWVYENLVTSWPGGVATVDGPSKRLFGGNDIPFIWLGRSEVETRIHVAVERPEK